MADKSGFFMSKKGYNGGYSSSTKDEDLEEEDIWGVINQISTSQDQSQKTYGSSSSSTWGLASNPRLIPRSTTSSNHETTKMSQQQSSAPMKITGWSSVYRGKKKSNVVPVSDHHHHASYNDDSDDDGDDDDEDMVPPHEYIAKKLARTQISSFSMCEGIGRTLKGRDLSKVRNAILSKTGFLE